MSQAKKSIQDSYEILEEIGKGGMAQVYKAKQVSLDRIVAVKEIKPTIAAHAELVERFKREARTAAGLVHENIIQVYNFGEPKKGALFIVLEFMDGKDLKTLFNAAGVVPPRIAAIVCREVARALAYAHSKGLIHRDVKPANIMISKNGEVKLMDFGIVREMDSDLTRTGAFLGTPAYMSPEQFLGDEITFASDIYSLGVLMYEILTGEKPFKADNDSSLSKKVRTEKEAKLRTLNPDIPRKMAKIVHPCMAKNPKKRPESAEIVSRALDKYLKTKTRARDRAELAAWFEQTMSGDKTVVAAGDKKESGVKSAIKVEKKPESKKNEDKSEKAGRQAKTVSLGDLAESAKKSKASSQKKKAEEKNQAEVEMEPTQRIDEEDTPDATAVLFKWAWRLILLTIAIFAAVIVYLSPLGDKIPLKMPDSVKSAVEWVQDKLPDSADEKPPEN